MAISGSGQPQFIASTGNRSFSDSPLIESLEPEQIVVPDRKSWKNLFSYMGPGFLVSIAYIDPGNFETDLQSGARYKYELLWIILLASCAALVIQSLAANLGVVTTFALNMLFNLPVWIGVLLTGLSTLVLLALQQYGVRKLEFLIAFLVITIAGCFFAEMGYAKPAGDEVVKGLFVPQLKGNGAAGLAISLLGAMVMPHNLFLHSALVLSRKIPQSVRGIKEACRFYLIESGLALAIAFLINVSVISVAGAVCGAPNLNPEDKENCQDLDLNKASFLLKNVLGGWSSKLFAIALLASGQSSTITGTYAGQYVMQMILSFELPFALIPLLKFTSSTTKMGQYANSKMISALTWIIGLFIMAINLYYLVTGFIDILFHGHLKLAASIPLGIVGFAGMGLYLAAIGYLVFRKNKESSHLLALTTPEAQGTSNGAGDGSVDNLPREDIVRMQLPERRDSN
ncbi:unnamed protein product [Linum tenue]|uniref:Uncharacterized protein n=1 Tax=Linum tenue TaxID=586396 RepID=A0AAV0KFF5_9ROSI|nr:unnamed protein product [Linum tenue]